MFSSLGKEMIPFPLIYDLLPSPKVTLPPFLDSKTLKKDWSPVMCLEQPLSSLDYPQFYCYPIIPFIPMHASVF